MLFLLLSSGFILAQEIEQSLKGIKYSSGPFEDPLGRFTMTVPAGWEGYSEEAGEDVCFLTCQQGYFGTFYMKMSRAEGSTSAKTIRDNELKKFEGLDTFKIISEEEVVLGGVGAIHVNMSQSFDTGDKMAADEYYLVKGDYAYVIHFDTSDSGYSLLSPDFKAIADSFKFN